MGRGTRKSRRGGKRKRASNTSNSTQSQEVAAASTEKINFRHPNPKRRKFEESVASSPAPKSANNKPSTFLDKMRVRLSGGHFRMLNEKLYTCSGKEAFNLFKDDPELFNVYHTGYQEQMSCWPEQPVNIIIKWLQSRNSSLVVADFGCGNASLARNVKNKVYSMDLISNEPSVIACDMSHTPLDSASVDVAVFCLSLMGTNFPSYLQEATRILKPCGWLLIAEVRSRFDPNNGGADPEKFSVAVKHLGFSLVSKDFTKKMFVLFFFKKKEGASKAKNIEWPELKPCIYKRR